MKPETVKSFGSMEPFLIKNNMEAWRYVTGLLIHINFVDLTTNLLSVLIILSFYEKIHGPAKAAFVFFLSGISGNILGSLLSDLPCTGEMASILGTIAATMGSMF
jgi:membrane associated rhomboid family serine protease